jgi:hypothetical protein
MNTTPPLIKPPPQLSAANLRGGTPSARPLHSENSPDGDLAADLLLIGIVPYGLPSGLLLAGWTFLALSLAGPFLVLVAIVLAMAVVVGVTAALVVLPYLLVRGVLRYGARRPRRHRLSDEVRERRAAAQLIPSGLFSRARLCSPNAGYLLESATGRSRLGVRTTSSELQPYAYRDATRHYQPQTQATDVLIGRNEHASQARQQIRAQSRTTLRR